MLTSVEGITQGSLLLICIHLQAGYSPHFLTACHRQRPVPCPGPLLRRLSGAPGRAGGKEGPPARGAPGTAGARSRRHRGDLPVWRFYSPAGALPRASRRPPSIYPCNPRAGCSGGTRRPPHPQPLGRAPSPPRPETRRPAAGRPPPAARRGCQLVPVTGDRRRAGGGRGGGGLPAAAAAAHLESHRGGRRGSPPGALGAAAAAAAADPAGRSCRSLAKGSPGVRWLAVLLYIYKDRQRYSSGRGAPVSRISLKPLAHPAPRRSAFPESGPRHREDRQTDGAGRSCGAAGADTSRRLTAARGSRPRFPPPLTDPPAANERPQRPVAGRARRRGRSPSAAPVGPGAGPPRGQGRRGGGHTGHPPGEAVPALPGSVPALSRGRQPHRRRLSRNPARVRRRQPALGPAAKLGFEFARPGRGCGSGLCLS
ncbi:translation initiation factor IF-2-like [Tyto alba]|uniref:translation initiation factor IF-2-like n=1 Tax=Tyto alba TaxID=56313 RepID=UPI001C675AC6|nr:translation initiation factor IF-2-like [Tyto alba]